MSIDWQVCAKCLRKFLLEAIYANLNRKVGMTSTNVNRMHTWVSFLGGYLYSHLKKLEIDPPNGSFCLEADWKLHQILEPFG